MITLCGSPVSNYYNKVKLALLEKGVAFAEEPCATKSTDKAVLAARRRGRLESLLRRGGAAAVGPTRGRGPQGRRPCGPERLQAG